MASPSSSIPGSNESPISSAFHPSPPLADLSLRPAWICAGNSISNKWLCRCTVPMVYGGVLMGPADDQPALLQSLIGITYTGTLAVIHHSSHSPAAVCFVL